MRVMTLGRLGEVAVNLPDGGSLVVNDGGDELIAGGDRLGACDPPARRRALMQGGLAGLVIGAALGALLAKAL